MTAISAASKRILRVAPPPSWACSLRSWVSSMALWASKSLSNWRGILSVGVRANARGGLQSRQNVGVRRDNGRVRTCAIVAKSREQVVVVGAGDDRAVRIDREGAGAGAPAHDHVDAQFGGARPRQGHGCRRGGVVDDPHEQV